MKPVTLALPAFLAVTLIGCASAPPLATRHEKPSCWHVTAPQFGLKHKMLCGTDTQWAEFMARAGVSAEAWKDMQRQRGVIRVDSGSNMGSQESIVPDRTIAYLPLQPDRFL